MDEVRWKLVVIESPFAGEVEKNLMYLRAWMRYCLLRLEAPYASHALYTPPGVLDDTIPAQRKLGMEAGFVWGDLAELAVVYVDRGISRGMKEGILRAELAQRPIVYRSLLANQEWTHESIKNFYDSITDYIESFKQNSQMPWL